MGTGLPQAAIVLLAATAIAIALLQAAILILLIRQPKPARLFATAATSIALIAAVFYLPTSTTAPEGTTTIDVELTTPLQIDCTELEVLEDDNGKPIGNGTADITGHITGPDDLAGRPATIRYPVDDCTTPDDLPTAGDTVTAITWLHPGEPIVARADTTPQPGIPRAVGVLVATLAALVAVIAFAAGIATALGTGRNDLA